MMTEGGTMDLRTQLAEALRPPHEDVEVRGVLVRVQALSAAEQMDMARVAAESDGGDLTFWLLERVLRDPHTDNRIFGDGDEQLRHLDGEELSRLADTALRLGRIEARAGNSEAADPSAISSD